MTSTVGHSKLQGRFSQQAISLVSKLFWYSFFTTLGTPLHRLMNKHWRGCSLLYDIVESTCPSWLLEALEAHSVIAPGVVYADGAFGLHVACAFLWMVLGYVQICHAHKLSGRSHKYFGYVTTATFLCHCFGALHNVYMDTVRHTALPKLLLICGVVSTATQFSIGIALAIQRAPGWLKKHQDYMVMAYIGSLSGAGTIRTIAHLQVWFNTGPIPCQNEYGGVASHCQAEYSNRAMLVALLGVIFCRFYVSQRKDTNLQKAHSTALRTIFAQTLLMIGLSYIPGWEQLIHQVFGSPRSFQCNTVVLLGVLYMLAGAVREFRSAFSELEQKEDKAVGDSHAKLATTWQSLAISRQISTLGRRLRSLTSRMQRRRSTETTACRLPFGSSIVSRRSRSE